jgi:hypothetical protein
MAGGLSTGAGILAADERLSAEFAGFAQSALDTLGKMRHFTE